MNCPRHRKKMLFLGREGNARAFGCTSCGTSVAWVKEDGIPGAVLVLRTEAFG